MYALLPWNACIHLVFVLEQLLTVPFEINEEVIANPEDSYDLQAQRKTNENTQEKQIKTAKAKKTSKTLQAGKYVKEQLNVFDLPTPATAVDIEKQEQDFLWQLDLQIQVWINEK